MHENRYTIDLLGTSITIRTEEDLQYIRQLEGRLSQAIAEVKEELGLADNLSVAIMAGIFLADENFKLKRQAPLSGITYNQNGAEQALEELQSLLDRALSK